MVHGEAREIGPRTGQAVERQPGTGLGVAAAGGRFLKQPFGPDAGHGHLAAAVLDDIQMGESEPAPREPRHPLRLGLLTQARNAGGDQPGAARPAVASVVAEWRVWQ